MIKKKITVPDSEELKKRLTPAQYKVTQECGTEPAFRNAYWNNKQPGIYVDIVDGEVLFSSLDKFDSGTGWPSFTKPLKDTAIVKKTDTGYGMVRTEVRAKASGSHLGHVFSDGPAPAGRRYCINSASLRFIPVNDMEKEGYGEYLTLFKDANLNLLPDRPKTEIAAFGAGCFWHVEETFRGLPGVMNTTVGYMGGKVKNPTYQQVCSHRTGHAEVCRVEYDTAKISYEQLLDVFWRIHDPTTYNRQGPDSGEQYRSVIFYYTVGQKEAALSSKAKLATSGKYRKPIVTTIVPASEFYRAEEYHQRYLEKQGRASCPMP